MYGSKSQEFLNWRADPAFFSVSFHPSRNLLQMSSFCLKYFSYIYSNMQWFLSGCNSQLSNLHPLKISNSLSTTLTQLRRQRRKADWVSISSVVKVDASTCLNITRSGSVFWRVREQQKTNTNNENSNVVTNSQKHKLTSNISCENKTIKNNNAIKPINKYSMYNACK